MARVSVIIPAYNAEATLAETLASVKAQTYSDWEVVIADDSSTDRTVEVADGFDSRVRVLSGVANQGPAVARNRALDAAGGELFALLDADDLWLPTYLERIVRLYDESRGGGTPVGIVGCDAWVLTPQGYLRHTFREIQGYPPDVSLARMLVANQLLTCGVLFPRAVLAVTGGFCPALVGTEDYDLWLRIMELGYRVAYTPDALTVYRVGPESVSSNPTRMARCLQLTYRRALDRGRLTPKQRSIARRQLRLQRALEQVGLVMSERVSRRLAIIRAGRNIPLFLRVAVENPDRWRAAVSILVGRGSPFSQVTR